MNRKLTVGSCFSGIGGIELGLERTGGFETKWQIENDAYASAVLAKHWPNVRRHGDIRTFARCEGCPDCGNPDCGAVEEWMSVDVICGGFPCQDVSLAGARAGLDGKRSTLWGEMFRIIRQVRPRWVVAENVPGLLSANDGRFFGKLLGDLASAGFDAEWGVLSAAGVGAPHLRRRVFIMAHGSQHGRRPRRSGRSDSGDPGKREQPLQDVAHASFTSRNESKNETDTGHDPWRGGNQSGGSGQDVADAKRSRRDGRTGELGAQRRSEDSDRREVCNAPGAGLSNRRTASMEQRGEIAEPQRSDWWSTKCRLGRSSNGVSVGLHECGGWECGVPRITKGQKNRVQRLRCLGNSVVPSVAQKIGEMILQFERNFNG